MGNTGTAMSRLLKKLMAFICPMLIFACIVSVFSEKSTQAVQQYSSSQEENHIVASDNGFADTRLTLALPVVDQQSSNDNDDDDAEGGDANVGALNDGTDYREISSLSTKSRKFFPIRFGNHIAYNPNIIPHPTKHDTWIIIAQHEGSCEPHNDLEELICDAIFWDDALGCISTPIILPVEPSLPGGCQGDLAVLNLQYGPRDARVFYSPDAPYIVYGSQSIYTCVSIWIQDIRMLLQDFRLEQLTLTKFFKQTTEVQRPLPYNGIEKNFFLFWDNDGSMYAHYDISPNRVFAQLQIDGSAGPDLAPLAAFNDNVCMAKYMPTVERRHESIHQATNSLSITLCKRSDPHCLSTDANTFIMTVFQHKRYIDFHAVYEPYVMLFQRTAPFAIHAISQRPLWINGREPFTTASGSIQWKDQEIPQGHTEMFYMTSMSWKRHGQKYHGHIDDELFLAFGIEDAKAGAIDVLAGDLLKDLALCAR